NCEATEQTRFAHPTLSDDELMFSCGLGPQFPQFIKEEFCELSSRDEAREERIRVESVRMVDGDVGQRVHFICADRFANTCATGQSGNASDRRLLGGSRRSRGRSVGS